MSTEASHANNTPIDRPPQVDESPRSIAPTPSLSSKGLLLALMLACLTPLASLSIYAIVAGRAHEHGLPVEVLIDRIPLPTADGNAQILEDVVVVTSLADHDIAKVTVNLNGQYFLYQDSPLVAGGTLVVRQAAFATKSNQRFVPGRYPIDSILVTGQLPSGARGVKEATF